MKLLGITGAKGSGKGVVASFVAEWANENGLLAIDRGFADKLKWAMARIFWPAISMEDAIEWANEFKNDEHMRVVIESIRHPSVHVVEVTGRELFQHGGTEMGREIFGDNFWVDQLLPRSLAPSPHAPGYRVAAHTINFNGADIGTISDLRFENEALRIRDLAGAIWQVRRPGYEPDGHASEIPLPQEAVHHIIDNTTDLDDLRGQVFECCNKFLGGGA